MRSSYKKEDVIFLLKDITGLVEPLPAKEREKRIQSGTHYCEMLPIEYVPTKTYQAIYRETLEKYADSVAFAVGRLADQIMASKGEETVLVSLARAGTPAGILLKRYILKKYQKNLPHYSISIIRGRGIDHAAMKYLLERYAPKSLLFIDGWIGKGAILKELQKEMAGYPNVSPELAVLADPANLAKFCGTHEDILIPSSCLNSTVSGLISRTFFREDIIGSNDFHGAIYYGELEREDVSYEFIEAIERRFALGCPLEKPASPGYGYEEVKEIAEAFEITDQNLIKPGIGETTRVLLRRIPFCVLMDPDHKDDSSLAHIKRLAEEKSVPLRSYPLKHYKTCGIIKQLSDL